MATSTEHRRLSKFLEKKIQNDPCSLEAYVAQIIFDNYAPADYLRDIISYGCANGSVSEMIYYADTHRFFDRFYDEIEELREDWELQTGAPIDIKGDLKNFFAWFAFEQTVWNLANEAGVDF